MHRLYRTLPLFVLLVLGGCDYPPPGGNPQPVSDNGATASGIRLAWADTVAAGAGGRLATTGPRE